MVLSELYLVVHPSMILYRISIMTSQTHIMLSSSTQIGAFFVIDTSAAVDERCCWYFASGSELCQSFNVKTNVYIHFYNLVSTRNYFCQIINVLDIKKISHRLQNYQNRIIEQ